MPNEISTPPADTAPEMPAETPAPDAAEAQPKARKSKAADTAPEMPKRYRVAFSAVGFALSGEEFVPDEGSDIAHLLDIGAIEVME